MGTQWTAGTYPYTADLQALKACVPTISSELPVLADTIVSPLILDNWRQALQEHPDRQFVEYILEGIAHGFHIGYDRSKQTCISTQRNMSSAVQNPGSVEDYLETELKEGHIMGPFKPEDIPTAQVSRLGVIPKRGQPGKWHLVLDLSSPPDHSVNDGIDKDICSLRYASVDNTTKIILAMGKGTWLAKVDVEHADRNIPVHRDNRLLLAMRWRGKLYLDTVLPFGLRSAPKIFTAIADALEWILANSGVTACIYLLP